MSTNQLLLQLSSARVRICIAAAADHEHRLHAWIFVFNVLLSEARVIARDFSVLTVQRDWVTGTAEE